MQPQQGCRFVFVFFCAPLALASGVVGRDIAVTEFMTNPNAVESTEWVELFNFSDSVIDLTGWLIEDELGDSATLPGIFLGSGEYLILTRSKAQFEAEWLSGVANAAVIELASDFALNNTVDQIVIRNALNEIIWNLAYINDETSGRATFLTGNDFTITDYGTSAVPGVSRSGDDLGIAGFLGYQENTFTADPFAYSSVSGDLGSPLMGQYTAMPAPGALALLALYGATSWRRRRIGLT